MSVEFEQSVNNLLLFPRSALLGSRQPPTVYVILLNICNTLILYGFKKVLILTLNLKNRSTIHCMKMRLFWFSSYATHLLACYDVDVEKALLRPTGLLDKEYTLVASAAPFTIKVGGTQFYCSKADNAGRRLRAWLAGNEFQLNASAPVVGRRSGNKSGFSSFTQTFGGM